VGVHDRGEADGQLWISMDFVDGLDAARLLVDRYPAGMPVDEVVRIVGAVASGLDYAHKQGLLHRDVKPANILLTHLDDDGEQRILLTDFGIARNLDDISGLTTTNLTVRTRKNGGLRAIGVVGRLRLCLGAERSVGRSAGCAGPAGGTGPSDVAHRAGQLRGTDVPSTSGRARPAGITVQQSSSNRLALGIGLSHKPVIETGFGLSFSHPIRHLREYLTVLTPLLAGRAVQMSGQHYRVQQEPSVPPGVKPPPVLVAALAPQMLRLAGELADGTALGAQPWT